MADYKRVLLKLSGEMLGENGKLFDFSIIDHVAKVLKEITESGVQLGVVIGAGNIWRGRSGGEMDRVTADQMGMLGTIINALAMKDAVIRAGGKAIVFSAIEMNRVAPLYTAEEARKKMSEGYVVLLAGGTNNPYFSTDTGVALRAVELNADAILLAKNIDGVYTADPKKDPSATLIRSISYEEAQEKHLKVIDAAAFALCSENRVPLMRVFLLDEPEAILKVLKGDDRGTVLFPQK